ncbi:uncharacterized protein [Rutidosis leptorrhynchoides]|uniref:uncharacterized protein n=1 Tax=Rutidosis leptorrhynchoides TaxID=125765 RepID=UPI003A999284
MRLKQPNMTDNEKEVVQEFANWIVKVGEGDVPRVSFKADEDENWIKIPEKYLIKAGPDPVYTIFNEVYPDFLRQYSNADYLKRRSILTPLNDTVNIINSQILSLMPGDVQSYLSYDCLDTNYSDYVMLLRNSDPSRGLCNGTHMIVKRCTRNVVEAIIVSGSKIGEIAHIPMISLSVDNKKWPFVLKRRQFPLRLAYAMTINKSQGQTLKIVGLYLSDPVFSHGQLYVSLSRVDNPKGLKILICNADSQVLPGCTKNIIFKEVFKDL